VWHPIGYMSCIFSVSDLLSTTLRVYIRTRLTFWDFVLTKCYINLQVEIVSITAGSVSVDSVVMFSAAEAAKADTFTDVLNAGVSEIFSGNAFATYGSVSVTRVVKSETTESSASGSVLLSTFTFTALVGLMATLYMMFGNGVF